jgi:uncharacterized protein (DUF1697 family)
MSWLREAVSGLGYDDVVTYVQSGNVVLSAPARQGLAVEKAISEAIASGLGLNIKVVVRTPTELAKVLKSNPFADSGATGTQLHVAFLDRAPAAAEIARIDPARSPGDEVVVAGREAYLFLPNGAGRSKLTNDYLERQLRVTATARNWNTVAKLHDLAAERVRPPRRTG